jgi:hypothetical protein
MCRANRLERSCNSSGLRAAKYHTGANVCVPLSELTDQVVELDLIDRSLVVELRDHLLNASSDLERIACVERILARRLDGARLVHPAVGFVCEAIGTAKGIVRISDLVTRTGLSHRRLMLHFGATLA